MSFAKLQTRLREEGWFVEWGMPCCQSCAWSDIPSKHEAGPFEGQEVDFDKVLMNHEQDCEVDDQIECEACEGEGMIESSDYDDTEPDEDGNEQYVDCPECDGEGYVMDPDSKNFENAKWFHTMYCFTPDHQSSSLFMFSNSDEGLKNLNDILPIIEESDCGYTWSGSGKSRIGIHWPRAD